MLNIKSKEQAAWLQASLAIANFGLGCTMMGWLAHAFRDQTVMESATRELKATEDRLFKQYEEYRKHGIMIVVREFVTVHSEQRDICEMLGMIPDTRIPIDMAMGVIFQGRVTQFQQDWIDGFSPKNGTRDPSNYAAMRVLCHLSGIETPASLVGCSCQSLGIGSGFGSVGLYFLPIIESWNAKLNQE